MAIPWLPLLSLGASLLGTAVGNRTSETQTQNSTTTGVTGQTAEQKSIAESTKTGSTTQQSTDTTTGQQTESVNRLDATTLASLTDGVRAMLQDAGKGSAALQTEIDRISGSSSTFDPDAFVAGLMESARSENESAMESGSNRIMTRAGVNTGSNSAAALLDAKLKRQGAANLAGIESNARQTAESIVSEGNANRASALTSLASGATSELSTMLTSLLNASQQSTGTNQQTGVGSTTGTTQETVKETGTTTQQQAGTTKQTTTGSASGSTSENNWADALKSLGSIFSATF